MFVDCNPTAMVATSKAKLATNAGVDGCMEVDSDERRQSSNLEVVHAQSPSTIQVLPALSYVAIFSLSFRQSFSTWKASPRLANHIPVKECSQVRPGNTSIVQVYAEQQTQ